MWHAIPLRFSGACIKSHSILFSFCFPLHRCKNALEKLSHLSGIKEHSIHGNKLTFELLSPGDSQVTGLLTLYFSQGRHPSAPWQLSNAEVRVQVDCKVWQVHIGSLYGDYTELSICTTDDSKTFGMSVSFMCACVKFVIHRSSQFSKDLTAFDVLLSQNPSVVQIKSSLLVAKYITNIIIFF